MKKTTAILFLVLVFCLSMFSCSKSNNNIQCADIVKKMSTCEANLPCGKFYSLNADETEKEYLSPSLLSALLGERVLYVKESWLDASFFLSLSSFPCEFATIRCKDYDSATDSAKLLSARLTSIKRTFADSEYASIADSAQITVFHNYVIFALCSEPEHSVNEAKKLLS